MHVYGNRLDAAQFFGSELAKVLLKAFLLPILGRVLDRPKLAVTYKILVTMAFSKCFFIDTSRAGSRHSFPVSQGREPSP